MLAAEWRHYRLDFTFTAITSREKLRHKDTYYIKVWDTGHPDVAGWGEAGLFAGLSCDDRPDYEKMLSCVCGDMEHYADDLTRLAEWPSIRFGLETALLDLSNGGRRMIHDTPWSRGKSSMRINGLIWMGDFDTMSARIMEKATQGFRCIKLKIGGIDFAQELELLRRIRALVPEAEIRLDANGAFPPERAMNRLTQLAEIGIHSIEQPIRQGQWAEMARLCRNTPIPIALDEELIGLNTPERRQAMMECIRPQYIILKPTLIGGMQASDEWIALARKYGAGWWATSALESNVGLNAIAQWVSTHSPALPQGLGTGQLYSNNIS
ncbi:MAG: o-succinylbenzoate synthase [Duncaniella sp.]|nr:o-succinylbenzoate synthase [Duncaniella sp.]